MNTAISMVIFKGVSKKGNDYYMLSATIIADGHLIKTKGLIFEDVALDLQKKGVRIVSSRKGEM